MTRKSSGSAVRRIVENPRETAQVYYPYKNKRKRFSKGLATCYELDKKNKVRREDLISLLPDEILVAILSLLSIKEAGRSSILSNRWRYLWTFYTGKLEIGYKVPITYCQERDDELSKQKLHYVSKILKCHHRGSVLDELIILFPGKLEQSRRIGRWVKFASKKCLRRFELDFTPHLPPQTYEEHFEFAQIDRVLLSHAGGFSSLTHLCFTYVNVTGEVIEHVLATCAFLKQLVVRKSYTLRFLEVNGKGLKLELLEVYGCTFLNILKINNADNLVSLTYDGESESLVFPSNAPPHLSKLMICGEICSFLNDLSCKHFSYIQHLECLKMKLPQDCDNRPVPPPRLPKMYHLKNLELHLSVVYKRTLLYFPRLIEACPLLSRFMMQYFTPPYISRREELAAEEARVPADSLGHDFEHGCLKVVELVGFQGNESDFELVFLLLKIAISIEKLTIAPYANKYDSPRESARKLKSIRKQLKVKLPSSVPLVML